MLSQSPSHIILGLRPSGQLELVDKLTGNTSFVDPSVISIETHDPSLLEFSVFSPRDLRFSARPRNFLSLLRQSRGEDALSSRKASSKKGKPHDSSSIKPSKRRHKSTSSTIDSLASQLSLLDPGKADAIRLAIAGLSPGSHPKRK
jgi:hypothetical protein